MAGPAIYDINLYRQAGINPRDVGIKKKIVDAYSSTVVKDLKSNIKAQLRIIDEQDAVNRYIWEGLPEDLTSQELERLIYYKGQLALFKIKELDKWYIMPYALDGGIDFYGRFNAIHPVPYASGGDEKDKKKNTSQQLELLSTIKRVCLYAPYKEGEIFADNERTVPLDRDDCCVLLHDYTKQLSQTIIPRRDLQEGLLDVMSEIIPYCRTALRNSTGVLGLRVQNSDEVANVNDANNTMQASVLNGKRYVPIKGEVDFQDLAADSASTADEFLMAMQSLDNFRLSTYGLDNGGVFEKQSHVLQSEQEMNQRSNSFVYDDGLKIRERFCEIANSIWPELKLSVRKPDSMLEAEAAGEEYIDEEVTVDERDPERVDN